MTNTVGIKYDKGKPRIAEMICDFSEPLLELCKVWEFGASKYGKSNWKDVDDGEVRYTNALVRHLLSNKELDDESNILHAAHIAFNSLARLYFILQRYKKPYTEPIIWKEEIVRNEGEKENEDTTSTTKY